LTENIHAALAVIALILLFAPALLLIVAAVRLFGRTGATASVLIAIGAVLLTLASLDFLYSTVIGVWLGPEALARFALVSFYVLKGANYLALLLIGVGLLLLPMDRSADRHN
jgi:hypothetical protein